MALYQKSEYTMAPADQDRSRFKFCGEGWNKRFIDSEICASLKSMIEGSAGRRSILYRLGVNPEVDVNALEALGGRQPGLDRSLAFLVLDGQLRRLAKAIGVVELYLGKALASLLEGGYEELGYARADDYCLEQLGFCRRTAELLRKQAVQVDRFPLIREAFLDATLNRSQALLLMTHLERYGGDEAELIALASPLTVRALRVRLADLAAAGQGLGDRGARGGMLEGCPAQGTETEGGEARGEAAGGSQTHRGDGSGDEEGLAGESVETEKGRDLTRADLAAMADAAGEPGPVRGQWREYRLTAEQFAEWQSAIEICQRVVGQDLKPFEVLELVAAEFLSGAPRPVDAGRQSQAQNAAEMGASRLLEGGGRESLDRPGEEPTGERRGGRWDRRGNGPALDWRQILEDAADCWRWLDDLPVRVELDPDLATPVPADPVEAHHLVSRLVLARRRLELYLGRMLRTMADYSLARQALFASICHYSAERLGLGASTTSRIIARERKLIRRQAYFDALVSGRISPTQADSLLRLPDLVPDKAWITFAEGRTCRSVEDAVRDFLAICAREPEFFRQRGWGPPSPDDEFRVRLEQAEAERAQALRNARSGAKAAPSAGPAGTEDPPGPTGTAISADGAGPAGAEDKPAPPGTSAIGRQEVEARLARAGLSIFSLTPRPGTDRWPIRIFVPEEVVAVIAEAEAAARQLAGEELSPEQCLMLFIADFLAMASEYERMLTARRRRILARSQYRCAVPGCRIRRNLHVHHVVFRSQGGSDGDENLVALCPAHHLRGVHEGRLRIRKEAGQTVLWELGMYRGHPVQVYLGERRLA